MKFQYIIVVWSVFVTTCPARLADRRHVRIYGGRPVAITTVPEQVSVRYRGFHTCGGSIIAENWVLTAGHCIRRTRRSYTIRAGSDQHRRGGSTHRVDKYAVHPNYRYRRYEPIANDIALLRVREPFKLDRTRRAVSLFKQDQQAPDGAMATVSGWGEINGGSIPRRLHSVQVPIISKSRCRRFYRTLPSGQICAGYIRGGKDACSGDSGGPLTVNGSLAGIVAWGDGCARARRPGVYTEVAHYRNWIKDISGV